MKNIIPKITMVPKDFVPDQYGFYFHAAGVDEQYYKKVGGFLK